MNILEANLQKIIDDFRFLIVDEQNVQRSSTWSIIHDENSVYVFVRTFGGKMKLSFHPIGSGRDGNDSQYGLTRKHAEEILESGFSPFKPLRWKRPNNMDKVSLCARILFPTDYMTGDVFQAINEPKLKVAIPLAGKGEAIDVSLFSHYLSADKAEDSLIKHGYTPFFYMTLNSGEMVSVAFRKIVFDKNLLPKQGNYPGTKLSDTVIQDSKNLHAVAFSQPNDCEAIQLMELNGFLVNKKEKVI